MNQLTRKRAVQKKTKQVKRARSSQGEESKRKSVRVSDEKHTDITGSKAPTPITFNSRVKGPHRALSNFHPCRLSAHGPWTTVEHEYQALKFQLVFGDTWRAAQIRSLATPVEAKKAGGKGNYVDYQFQRQQQGSVLGTRKTKTQLKKEWDSAIQNKWHPISLETMRGLLIRKFDPLLNPELHQLLMNTGQAPLHEVNRKSFWTRAGGDHLGKLLVEVRTNMQNVDKKL